MLHLKLMNDFQVKQSSPLFFCLCDSTQTSKMNCTLVPSLPIHQALSEPFVQKESLGLWPGGYYNPHTAVHRTQTHV